MKPARERQSHFELVVSHWNDAKDAAATERYELPRQEDAAAKEDERS